MANGSVASALPFRRWLTDAGTWPARLVCSAKFDPRERQGERAVIGGAAPRAEVPDHLAPRGAA